MKHKKRLMGKKHKRIAAAVAGAAILSSAMLPGLSAPVVHASAGANKTVVSSTVNVSDPVQVVIDNGSGYGFDANARYSLLSQYGSKAVVRVRSNGQTFKVDLAQRDGNWVVKTIRGVGDETHPATYTTGGFLSNFTAPAVATLGVSQQVLYQTNKYDNWVWDGDTYPQNMAFGVLLQNPQSGGIVTPFSGDVLKSINNIDFNRQFTIYAHLGTIAKGYGIGISRIDQSDNDITVTVKLKNQDTAEAAQTDSFVTLDRSMINTNDQLNVTFVDVNGAILGKYVINPH